jgi:hypothetical protein
MGVKNLQQFVIQNAAFLTLTDMVHETGLPMRVIWNKCKELKIKPIKASEQTKQFILDHHLYKSPQEIAKLLDCGEEYMRKLYKQLGISFPKSETSRMSEAYRINKAPIV